MVIAAFAHTLLVGFVFRIILFLLWFALLFVVLEIGSRQSLYRASADTDTDRYRQNPNAVF